MNYTSSRLIGRFLKGDIVIRIYSQYGAVEHAATRLREYNCKWKSDFSYEERAAFLNTTNPQYCRKKDRAAIPFHVPPQPHLNDQSVYSLSFGGAVVPSPKTGEAEERIYVVPANTNYILEYGREQDSVRGEWPERGGMVIAADAQTTTPIKALYSHSENEAYLLLTYLDVMGQLRQKIYHHGMWWDSKIEVGAAFG